MAPAILLIGATLVFRGLGALGVGAFNTWVDSTRVALALMFLFTAAAHFNRMKDDLIRMVPPSFPNPRVLVFATGALEILGAIGLLVPATRRLAAWGLALMLLALFPANVSAAGRHLTLRGKPVTPLAIRFPIQILFLAACLWVALGG
jgi:uncharacterized membrane protein